MSELNGNGVDNTAIFNIKAVVNQTGLNPATIRAWERRYGFPNPTRTEGGHRQYSQRDIDTLKWLIARQEEGVSISHAIELWRTYIEREEDPLQNEAKPEKQSARPAPKVLEGGQIDQLRKQWVSACLSFNRESAEQILVAAFARFNPETVCVEVLQKGLAEIGNGWYEGEVTVQQEHFASALSIQRLEMLIAATPSPSRPERIVIATAPGDYHVFGPLLLTFLLRQRGLDIIYLGADVPADELESTIDQVQPDLIIVAAQLLHTAAALKDLALAAQDHDVPLAFGGLVFTQMPSLRRLIPGYFLGETLEEAVQWVDQSIARDLTVTQSLEAPETLRQALTQYSERRALIESHVWGTFIATNNETDHLTSVNRDIAQTIEAALKLGDIKLLDNDVTWIEHLLMGYRLPKAFVADYILAYYQAARIHLGGPAQIIVDWLSNLISNKKN